MHPIHRLTARTTLKTAFGLIFALLSISAIVALLSIPARADEVSRQAKWLPECQPSSALLASWPITDFDQCTVDLREIISGGPPKDGIPPIDMPEFISVTEVTLDDREPVISLVIEGEAKAYPLSILTWHEIVNDVVGGVPVSVTYCPLCNATIVFDRRLDDTILDFGTTGTLRHSDLVMYDRQTESFWQQYNGDAIAGAFAGAQLSVLPSRLESFAAYRARYPEGDILAIPTNFIRRYGMNPYVGYDESGFPFLFKGEVPKGIKPLERVVVVDNVAIALPYIQERGSLRHKDYHINWQAGQASALDSAVIAEGRDVGTVTVQRAEDHGKIVDVPYKVTFAFVWHAFEPEKPIIGLMP